MSRLVKIVNNKYVQIEEYKNPNICFNTNEYDNFEDYCTLRETFDPFEIFYENQELKKQLEDLQETHYLIQGGRSNGKTYLMKLQADKEQLNSLVNSCQEEIRKLKEQVEEYKKFYKDELEENSKLSELWCDSRAKIRELEKQQKEFIEFLEDKEKQFDAIGEPKNAGACKGILQKYKSIIGVSDEKEN